MSNQQASSHVWRSGFAGVRAWSDGLGEAGACYAFTVLTPAGVVEVHGRGCRIETAVFSGRSAESRAGGVWAGGFTAELVALEALGNPLAVVAGIMPEVPDFSPGVGVKRSVLARYLNALMLASAGREGWRLALPGAQDALWPKAKKPGPPPDTREQRMGWLPAQAEWAGSRLADRYLGVKAEEWRIKELILDVGEKVELALRAHVIAERARAQTSGGGEAPAEVVAL